MELLTRILGLIEFLTKLFDKTPAELEAQDRREILADSEEESLTKRPKDSFWRKRGL